MPDLPSRLDETLDAKPYEPPRKRRFTLISFMVGVLVVAVLALGLLVFKTLRRTTAHGPRVTVGFLITDVRLACENFRLETGRYPWVKADEVTAATEIDIRDVYAELRGLPEAKLNTSQDYLGDVRKRFLRDGMLVDLWGHAIMIRVDPKTGQAVIWSCGPNGVDETNDGGSPDPAKLPKGYYWFGKSDTGDDITTL